MSAKKTGDIIASRIIRLVEEDNLMQALEELGAVAEFNKLEELGSSTAYLKDQIFELESLLRSRMIFQDLGLRERFLLSKKILALATEVRKMGSLKIPESLQRGVSLLLNPSIEVSEAQREDLFQTLKRILGVKESEIKILRTVA